MKQPVRVALYIRSHTNSQPLVDVQIEQLRNACLRENKTVAEIYVDHGFSGRNLDRPSLQRLLTDAATGRFDEVRVIGLHKLSRRMLDLLRLTKTLDSSNVSIVTENFDSRAALILQQTMASLKTLMQETTDGHDALC
ncbi:MAG TPA: recombinase family protein [Paenibacillus sp.]|uniref:recombinase family protein n=1 Tax=Paenibacillus sp. TaxID=58172 RepID=UPI0028D5E627|nr:recombinase family protein [Paenibacillus sp.]HUC93636.1 recombinase family protein [Paenibacillus sp.]